MFYHTAYGDCPHGFEHVANSCYKIEALESSWVEAKVNKSTV